MSNMFETFIVIGNVGKGGARLVPLDNGTEMLAFDLCEDRVYVDKDGKRQSRPVWHKCRMFNPGRQGYYMPQGRKVAVQVRLEYVERTLYTLEGEEVRVRDALLRVSSVEFLTPMPHVATPVDAGAALPIESEATDDPPAPTVPAQGKAKRYSGVMELG